MTHCSTSYVAASGMSCCCLLPSTGHAHTVSTPQLLQVYRFAGPAVLQVCYVLITDEAVYILEDSECFVWTASVVWSKS